VPDWDDTDYSAVTGSYAAVRRADPVVAAQILDALGSARTVVNVGAGTGSYEPTDRHVVAVEPSAEMRKARPRTLPPALDGRADRLPFDDNAFEAALAVLTVHHWADLRAGLRELRRVACDRVVIMTADPEALERLWIPAYAPEFHEVERRRYPSLQELMHRFTITLRSDGVWTRLSPPVPTQVPPVPAVGTAGLSHAQPLARSSREL
jgi:SAM-dependent methyltransferase